MLSAWCLRNDFGDLVHDHWAQEASSFMKLLEPFAKVPASWKRNSFGNVFLYKN